MISNDDKSTTSREKLDSTSKGSPATMSTEVIEEKKVGRGPTILNSLALVAGSILISGTLYQIAKPNIAPHLSPVNRPTNEFSSWSIVTMRAIEVIGYVYFGYTSTKDIVCLAILARASYVVLLHTSYSVPIFALAMIIFVDTISMWALIRMLAPAADKDVPVRRLEIKKEVSLTVVLTLIASSILAISLYVAQKTTLPAFVIGHFEDIQNIGATPLPLLLFGFLPFGWAIQEMIYTHGFHSGSIAMLTSSFVVGSGKVALGVKGGDLLGIFGTLQFWNASIATAALVIGYILRV